MSGGRGGQLDERIVAQRCDGFQGHVAGALDGPPWWIGNVASPAPGGPGRRIKLSTVTLSPQNVGTVRGSIGRFRTYWFTSRYQQCHSPYAGLGIDAVITGKSVLKPKGAAMTLSRVVIRNPAETPVQLIKEYVDWVKSHPSGAGTNEPASVGFMMAQNVPLEFGPDVAVSSRGLQPAIIYSQGNLSISGGTSLVGHGFARSSGDGFGKTVSISVRLDAAGTLTVNSGEAMDLTLHHDVLVGSTPAPSPHLLTSESTSVGEVATLMLWGIPASVVR